MKHADHHHDHAHDHAHERVNAHEHGHPFDREARGLFRYLRLLPRMWASEVNREVVRSLALARGECVVDLGAGMGAATVEAIRSGATVIAVDPMPYMRQIVQLRRAWQRHRTAIRVVDGAAESIPLPDATVDALFTVNTIHHWTERDVAARELARVMKKGGRVLLVDEDFEDSSHPDYEPMRAARARHEHHFDQVDPEQIAASLVGAGFAQAHGSRESITGRPSKVIRAIR